MTAKEYFKAYQWDYEHMEACGRTEDDIYQDIADRFVEEVNRKIRGGQIATTAQLQQELTQQNEKWLALHKRFKGQYGYSPLYKTEFRRKIIPYAWPFMADELVLQKSRGKGEPLNIYIEEVKTYGNPQM